MKIPFQAIFMAHPGGGKSVTLGSAADDPRLGTILMADTDNKIHSIASKIEQEVTLENLLDENFKLAPKGINLIRHLDMVKSNNEIKKVVDFLYTGAGCTKQVDTFFFDTLSSYDSNLFLDLEKTRLASTNQKVRDDNFSNYNAMTREIVPMLNLIANTPINFIGTAHIVENMPEDGEVYTVPKFSGKKLSIAVSGIFPLVAMITTVPKNEANGSDVANLRRFVFSDTWKAGLRGIHNQYEGNTLGESVVYRRDQPILSLIMDGCNIPYPEKAKTKESK